jgi:hypothetical protein
MAPKPQRLSSLVCWTIEVKLSASNIAGNRPMPFLTSQTANLTAPSTGFSHDERGTSAGPLNPVGLKFLASAEVRRDTGF